MGKKETSKFISLILRHRPEAAGIVLDEHGWADVDELIRGINGAGRHRLDRELLEEIVREDEKQRYSFNEDHTLIRANQGHSIPVDVELPVTSPPATLWHGTADRFVPSIMAQGIRSMNRLYVHLSPDTETARKVGSRHGKPVILRINSGQMEADGAVFYLSVNGVWLTKEVPAKYITVE